MGSPAHDGPGRDRLEPRSSPAPPRTALTTAERRAFTALLRERAHRLIGLLAPEVAAAVRFLPVLLHASFERTQLRGDAPGVAGLRFRSGWTSRARDLGIPPPCRAQRERSLLEAILAMPSAGALDVIAVVRRPASLEELGRAQERLDAVRKLLARRGVATRLVLFDAARL